MEYPSEKNLGLKRLAYATLGATVLALGGSLGAGIERYFSRPDYATTVGDELIITRDSKELYRLKKVKSANEIWVRPDVADAVNNPLNEKNK